MAYKNSLLALLAFALFASALGTATLIPGPTAAVPADPETKTTPESSATDPKTTAAPPTTAAPATTAAPPTTTPAPPTTAAPVTTPAPPTTPAPVTTPAPAPSTTAAPPPSDGRGNWTVSDGAVICIIAQMVVSVKVDYPLITPNSTGNVVLAVPALAKAQGTCGPSSQVVKITWESNDLEVNFEKNDTTKVYDVSQIRLSILADDKTFPNISTDLIKQTFTLESSSHLFSTNVNQSYRCIREESLPMSKSGSVIKAVLVLNKVQLQAFHTGEAAVFESAQDCELDTPDVVPIAVGCALAALVCVVLVAYLVGRRRSQARGYLSM